MKAATPLGVYSGFNSSLFSFFCLLAPSLNADFLRFGLSSFNFFFNPGNTPFVVAAKAPL